MISDKKLYLAILLSLLCSLAHIRAGNITITAESGVRYILDLEKKTAEVTFKAGFNSGSTGSNYTFTDLIIPETIEYDDNTYLITSIGSNAFYNCSKLERIQLPDNIVSIGDHAFYKCQNLTSFEFPEELTSIGASAFYWCSKIESLVFPLKLTEIPELAFEYFYALTFIQLPPGISYIGKDAFYTPSTIKDKIICLNPTPIQLYGNNVFATQVWNGTKIYVPAGSVEAYKKLNGWNKARNILPLTEATALSINGTENTIKIGQQIEVSVSLLPEDVTCSTVEWKVEDPSLAKISQKGVITGISAGQTNVIATTLDGSNLTAVYPITILEDKKVLLGDSNDSGAVTVADVTTTANYIINLPVAKWNFENADVNADNKISTADVTGTLDIILNESDSYHLRRTRGDAAEEMSDRLISDNYVSGDSQAMIGVRLERSRPYSALQASLIVPEGMKVKDIEGGPRLSDHTLLFNEAAPGVVKIIIFSFTNTEFNSEDAPLFYIVADTRNAEGDLRIEDVFASDAGSHEYELGFEGGVNETLTTGIVPMNVEAVIIHTVSGGIEVLNAEGEAINVYRFTGETMAAVHQASSFEEIRLQPGMYIVKVGDSTAKVIVK